MKAHVSVVAIILAPTIALAADSSAARPEQLSALEISRICAACIAAAAFLFATCRVGLKTSERSWGTCGAAVVGFLFYKAILIGAGIGLGLLAFKLLLPLSPTLERQFVPEKPDPQLAPQRRRRRRTIEVEHRPALTQVRSREQRLQEEREGQLRMINASEKREKANAQQVAERLGLPPEALQEQLDWITQRYEEMRRAL